MSARRKVVTRPRQSDIPDDWHARLVAMADEPPANVSPMFIHRVAADGSQLLGMWSGEIERLGWTALDLFGVHPSVPESRFDVMGLVPMLRGGAVRAISPVDAVVGMPTGSILRYQRKLGAQPRVAIWECH